jgi:hypothetical protein
MCRAGPVDGHARARTLLDEAFGTAQRLGAHGVFREAELLNVGDRSPWTLRVS